jgi:hypothetical protein
MLESPLNTKNESIRNGIFMLITQLANKYRYSFQITITIVNNFLCKFEHAVNPLMALMSVFIDESENEQIVIDVLREIGKLNPYGRSGGLYFHFVYFEFAVDCWFDLDSLD